MGQGGRHRSSRLAARVATVAVGALAIVGCTSDPAPARPTVTPATAYVAIVQWEVEQSDPVVDEDGNIEPPVIYLASNLGGTVDVGVQADVVAIIDDVAVIRFADDPRDARDEGIESEPVKDEGVMIIFDEFDPDQTVVDALISRYRSVDDVATWALEITATNVDGEAIATVTSAAPVDG